MKQIRTFSMKRITDGFLMIAVTVSMVIVLFSCGEKRQKEISIIPRPAEMEIKSGEFVISPGTKILIEPAGARVRNVADYLVDRLRNAAGFELSVETFTDDEKAKNSKYILLSLTESLTSLGDEGYSLSANKDRIVVKALKPAGLFYGVQTLFQLLPAEIYGDKLVADANWSVPAVEIKDKPRFKWRGMHLDVARHFFSKQSVKRYIDMLAMHKMNIFHWHLVDDQGWRIEIKKYPKLVEIGSRRADLPWNDWQGKAKKDTPVYSGYYTQEDIKEIVAYAQKRFITIVPEIEMPGHTMASLAAYPELSCTGGPFTVPSGGVDIWTNHTYCPGNEKTFEFLENVLSEIMELFPSQYIHIGGDETTQLRWKECPKCQKRVKEEHLKSEDELYGYFINRIEKFLESRGRILIGWDEILEGGESINGTVMAWRGADRCIKAVNRGLDVVQAPSSHLYFDDIEAEDENRIPLEMVYSYEPVPEGLSVDGKKHILGAEACVWTENVTSMKQVEYLTLPRMAALAEVVWSDKDDHNFEDFLGRLSHQYARYDVMKFNYRQPDLEGGFHGIHVFTDSVPVKIIKPRLNSKVYYTLDGSEPTRQSLLYDKPFYIKTSTVLKAREFLSDGRKGRVRSGIYDKQELRKSVDVDAGNLKHGLYYKYLEGKYESTDQISFEKSKESGVVDSFVFPPNHSKLFFAVLYSGFIHIPDDGVYTFYCETNDGSQLFIDDKLVVDHGGLHPAVEKASSIALQAGYHPIRVIYFQNAGSCFIKISYRGPKVEKQEIPASVLFYR